MSGLVIDLFAGGGGASAGIEAALGRPVDIAINHDRIALAAHKANHPKTLHLEADIWEVKPTDATGGRPVDLLWASPDCTHFSVAKGNVPRKQKIRSLAWAVARWAAATKPRVIFVENVSEFRTWGPLGADGRPVKRRMGATFLRWKGKLEKLGYRVEFTVLDAAEHGAPTRRRRLFIVARRDGRPVRWPEPTHGPGREPFRTAAECIDWALACPSIFERERPLAEKTLWRIAQGIKRFVLENPKPFIVQMSHGEAKPGKAPRWGKATRGVDEPLPTVTGSNDFAVAMPSIVKMRGEAHSSGPLDPLPTITAGGDKGGHTLGLLTPILTASGGPEYSGKPRSVGEPLSTVLADDHRVVVAPSLIKVNHGAAEGKVEARGESIEAPLSTVTAARRGHGMVAATLVQTGYGEREGQSARVPHVNKPLGTIVAGGQKHAVAAAMLLKHFGGVVGQEIEQPTSTITSKDHHSLAAASLVRFNHDDAGIPVDEPMPTILANGLHVAEVRAFLTTYYTGGAVGQKADAPLRTVTSKDRLGLVTVEGSDYQIVDIGMRMLEPHELLKAQFGRFADGYDLSAAVTKSAKVRLIGNSVCPEVAEAVVRANMPEGAIREAVA